MYNEKVKYRVLINSENTPAKIKYLKQERRKKIIGPP